MPFDFRHLSIGHIDIERSAAPDFLLIFPPDRVMTGRERQLEMTVIVGHEVRDRRSFVADNKSNVRKWSRIGHPGPNRTWMTRRCGDRSFNSGFTGSWRWCGRGLSRAKTGGGEESD